MESKGGTSCIDGTHTCTDNISTEPVGVDVKANVDRAIAPSKHIKAVDNMAETLLTLA